MDYKIDGGFLAFCNSDQIYQCRVSYKKNDALGILVELGSASYVYEHKLGNLSNSSGIPTALIRAISEYHKRENVFQIFEVLRLLQTQMCEDAGIHIQEVTNECITFILNAFDSIAINYRDVGLSLWNDQRDYFWINGIDENNNDFFQELMNHPKVRLKRLFE